MTGDVTDELREIYRKAYGQGIWLREFAPAHGGNFYMAAAGSVRDIEALEKRIGREIDVSTLELGDLVELSAPGTGSTREEACRNAVKAYKAEKKRKRR